MLLYRAMSFSGGDFLIRLIGRASGSGTFKRFLPHTSSSNVSASRRYFVLVQGAVVVFAGGTVP